MPHIAVARSRLKDAFARQKNRLARLLAAIELAIEVRRERRFLLGLDNRALKDLGLNGDAYAEAARPFWDLPIDRLRT